jgi:hypothetical protein
MSTSTFASLKKSRSSSLDRLKKESEKLASGGSKEADKRFWIPGVDKAGNGYAVIRFLPEPKGEDFPWVRVFRHSFQNAANGKWYIENSLTTFGEKDPCGEYNTNLWNNGGEEGQKQASAQKRKVGYTSNILVITDTNNRENEGKVFLFSYGKKIWDKINEAMNPVFPDAVAFNPYDFWEGANFKLKIRTVDKYRNYDQSEFEKPAALFDGDDERLEAVYTQLNSLAEFLDRKNFKTYEELEKNLQAVLGLGGKDKKEAKKVGPSAAAPETPSVEDDFVPESAETEDVPFDTEEDDDGGLSFFENLAKG